MPGSDFCTPMSQRARSQLTMGRSCFTKLAVVDVLRAKMEPLTRRASEIRGNRRGVATRAEIRELLMFVPRIVLTQEVLAVVIAVRRAHDRVDVVATTFIRAERR